MKFDFHIDYLKANFPDQADVMIASTKWKTPVSDWTWGIELSRSIHIDDLTKSPHPRLQLYTSARSRAKMGPVLFDGDVEGASTRITQVLTLMEQEFRRVMNAECADDTVWRTLGVPQ